MCEIKEHKEDINQTKITVGGNTINYEGDVGTPTTDLETVIFLLNCSISTVNSIFITTDINKFYTNTPLDKYKYLHIRIDDVLP